MKTQSTKLDFRQSLVLAGLLASALYSQVARAAELDLSADWLGADGRLQKSEFMALLNVAGQDSGTSQLIKDVTKKMGFAQPSELYELIRICKAGENSGEQGHLATHEETHITYPKLGYENAEYNPPRADELMSIATDNRGPARTERFAFTPEICIIPSLSVGEAAVVLAHELTHLMGYVPFSEHDILTYKDKGDYALSRVTMPGGELDAHVAHTHLSKTLGTSDSHHDTAHYGKYLASDGTLADREGMIADILENGGYRDRLEAEYVTRLRSEIRKAQAELAETPTGGNPVFLTNATGLRKAEVDLEKAIATHPSNEAELVLQLEATRKQRKEQEVYIDRQKDYARQISARKSDLESALRKATAN